MIGFVGTTGVKVSPPHLHFEVRVDDMFTNPLRVLGDWAIPPKATMTHYYMLKAKRQPAATRAPCPPPPRRCLSKLLAPGAVASPGSLVPREAGAGDIV